MDDLLIGLTDEELEILIYGLSSKLDQACSDEYDYVATFELKERLISLRKKESE